MKKLAFLILLYFPLLVLSQEISISGNINADKKPLEGANIYLIKNKNGAYSNTDGNFRITNIFLPDSAIISFVGYKTQKIKIDSDKIITINLIPEGNILEGAVVIDSYNQVRDVNTGEIKLNSKDIEQLPIVFGEQDIVKLLQFLPGVQQGKEGQSGMFVRGGNNSMNLFLIDDIYLHNTSHIGGFLSAINSDIIDNLTFNKSGIPAQYGGKLSSVVAVNTNPSSDDFSAKGSIGLISSKLSIKQPLESINTSIQISGRRTYFDLVKPIFSNNESNSMLNGNLDYYFYDFTIKTKTIINEKNEISLLAFNTFDLYRDNNENSYKNMQWGNTLLGLEWKHYFNDNAITKTIISKSNYKFSFEGIAYPYTYTINSDVNIYSFKNHTYIQQKNNKIKFGIEYNYNEISPKKVSASLNGENLKVENPGILNSHDFSVFISDEFSIGENLLINGGLRLSNFIRTDISNGTDNYDYKYYFGIEPRLSMRYILNNSTSLKLSYNRIFQYFHQATMASLSLPIDFYLPSTLGVAPQEVNQISSGVYKKLKGFDLSAEVYYKLISNMSEFRNGSINNLFNPNLYDDMVFGKTHSLGIELSVSKKVDKVNLMASYTLSKSISIFDDINKGNPFSSAFDRPHNFNTLINYKLTEKIDVSAVFVFTSGQNYTAPTDIRIINESVVINYSNKNSERYPNYHRADVSVTYKFESKKHFKSKLNLTIYNFYNNKNPFYIDYIVTGDIANKGVKIEKKVTTLFPILPTVTWMFEIF